MRPFICAEPVLTFTLKPSGHSLCRRAGFYVGLFRAAVRSARSAVVRGAAGAAVCGIRGAAAGIRSAVCQAGVIRAVGCAVRRIAVCRAAAVRCTVGAVRILIRRGGILVSRSIIQRVRAVLLGRGLAGSLIRGIGCGRSRAARGERERQARGHKRGKNRLFRIMLHGSISISYVVLRPAVSPGYSLQHTAGRCRPCVFFVGGG